MLLLPPEPVDFAGAVAVFGESADALVPPPPPPPPRDAFFFDLRELDDPLLDAVGDATAAAEGVAEVVVVGGGGPPAAPLRAAAGDDGVNPLRREKAAGVGPPLPAAARSRHERSVTDGGVDEFRAR